MLTRPCGSRALALGLGLRFRVRVSVRVRISVSVSVRVGVGVSVRVRILPSHIIARYWRVQPSSAEATWGQNLAYSGECQREG